MRRAGGGYGTASPQDAGDGTDMRDTYPCVRKCRERVPRSAGDDAGQMRLALVRGRDDGKRSGISNAQRAGDDQQAASRDSAQDPRCAALAQPGRVSVSIEVGIGHDLRQPVQHVRMRGEQCLQSWISFTSCDASSNLRRPGLGLRLVYLRIRALFARHARCGATAHAVSGSGGDQRAGIGVHVSFMPRRAAAVKPLLKKSQSSPTLYNKSSARRKPRPSRIPGAIATV